MVNCLCVKKYELKKIVSGFLSDDIIVNHGINFKMALKKNLQCKAFLSSRCKPQNERDSAYITHNKML